METTKPDDGSPAETKDEDAGRIGWLDAADVKLFRDEAGHVRATVRYAQGAAEGSRSVLRPALHRAFPITLPDTHVELREQDGDSVGMLRDLAALDRDSRALAEGLLRERYVVPVIECILDLRHAFGMWTWRVETDRGEREFSMKSPRDDVRRMAGGKVRVTDVHGNTFEISDRGALDPHSRALFAQLG